MTRLKNIGEINTTTLEGRYLLAAIAIITTECRRDKKPDTVLHEIHDRSVFMFTSQPKLEKSSVLSYQEIHDDIARYHGYKDWKTYNAMATENEIKEAMRAAEQLHKEFEQYVSRPASEKPLLDTPMYEVLRNKILNP